MAEELEELWKKLTVTEAEDEDIKLGSNSTKAAKEVGKNCMVMKILTQRTIILEALKKNMRMLWKPSQGMQISEIDEDLFLVEFGNGRDKKKVMEMSPWSYEKQLILMQDFEGELVPKEIKLKWVPFWVQIFNLPLKCMTKESGYEIGSKIGVVLDIDVPEKGVQWGKFLRVRIRFDATAKLIRGKKVSIEEGESRWVFFKYERLPNFCYRCGRLDHGEKDCPERKEGENYGDEERKQYGAWLRGEPGRSTGRDYGRMGDENMPEKRDEHKEPAAETPTRVNLRLMENSVVGRQHVREQNLCQKVGICIDHTEHGEAGQKEESYQRGEIFHENGKVSFSKAKVEDNLIKSGKVPLTGTLKAKDTEEDMQWEEGMNDVVGVKSEEGGKHKKEISSKSCADKENQNWAESESSPLAMSYDQVNGWTTEILGPKSGHWKRLARQVKEKGPTVVSDPANQKRKGEAPLIELDPNVKCKKRAKGKAHSERTFDEEKKMVGDVAVAAMQHRPAQ
nr:uncharacterized protein CFP56_13718 [Quercus suber]